MQLCTSQLYTERRHAWQLVAVDRESETVIPMMQNHHPILAAIPSWQRSRRRGVQCPFVPSRTVHTLDGLLAVSSLHVSSDQSNGTFVMCACRTHKPYTANSAIGVDAHVGNRLEAASQYLCLRHFAPLPTARTCRTRYGGEKLHHGIEIDAEVTPGGQSRRGLGRQRQGEV